VDLKNATLRNIAQITEGTAMGEHERYNMQRLIKVRAKYLAMTWLARHGRLIARSPNSARLRRRHRGNSRASSPNAGDAGRIVARPVAGG
jgi:hypothetical protein